MRLPIRGITGMSFVLCASIWGMSLFSGVARAKRRRMLIQWRAIPLPTELTLTSPPVHSDRPLYLQVVNPARQLAAPTSRPRSRPRPPRAAVGRSRSAVKPTATLIRDAAGGGCRRAAVGIARGGSDRPPRASPLDRQPPVPGHAHLRPPAGAGRVRVLAPPHRPAGRQDRAADPFRAGVRPPQPLPARPLFPDRIRDRRPDPGRPIHRAALRPGRLEQDLGQPDLLRRMAAPGR